LTRYVLKLPAFLLDPVIGRVDGGELVVGEADKLLRHAEEFPRSRGRATTLSEKTRAGKFF